MNPLGRPYIDPGEIANVMAQLNNATGIGNTTTGSPLGGVGNAYLDYMQNGPLMKGPNPWDSYEDVAKYATSDEGIQNSTDILSNFAAGINLFKNPLITAKAKEALEPLAGKLATERWIGRTEDVPDAYQKSPALGMLKELYETLGIKNKPELQGRFGTEIEGAARIPRESIAKSVPNTWKVGSDGSVRPQGPYQYTYEIRNNEPFHGLEGAKQFLLDTRFLRAKEGTTPIHSPEGVRHNAGGHFNYSREGLNTPEVQRYVEDYVKNWEPILYPQTQEFSKRDLDTYAKPLSGYLYTRPASLFEQASGRPFGNWDKYTAINLNHFDPGSKLSRIEERFWDGTADPEEWLKRFILAETRMNSAASNPELGRWASSGKVLKRDIEELANDLTIRPTRAANVPNLLEKLRQDVYSDSLDKIAGRRPTNALNADNSFLDNFQVTPEQLRNVDQSVSSRGRTPRYEDVVDFEPPYGGLSAVEPQRSPYDAPLRDLSNVNPDELSYLGQLNERLQSSLRGDIGDPGAWERSLRRADNDTTYIAEDLIDRGWTVPEIAQHLASEGHGGRPSTPINVRAPQAPRSANPWDEPERRSIPGWESFGDLEPDIYNMVRSDVRSLGRALADDPADFALLPEFLTGAGLSETGHRQADMLRSLFDMDPQVTAQLPTIYGRIANLRGSDPATLNRQMLSEHAGVLNRDFGVDIHPDDLWLARASIAEYIRNHPGLANEARFLVD